MPPSHLSVFLFVIHFIGHSLPTNEAELAQLAVEDQAQPYCELGPDQAGMSTFYLGTSDSDPHHIQHVCNEGRFFDYSIDKDSAHLGPKGCTLCPQQHYMDSRNYCLGCKRCGVCSEDEVEVQSCKPHSDVICERRPANGTVGIPLDTTTVDRTTGSALSTPANSPTCSPCVCASTPASDNLSTTPVTEEGQKTAKDKVVNLNVVIPAVFLVAIILLIIVLVIGCWYITKRRKTGGRIPGDPSVRYDAAPQDPNDQDNGEEGRVQIEV